MKGQNKYFDYLEKGVNIRLPDGLDERMKHVIGKAKEEKPSPFFALLFRPGFAFAALLILALIPSVIVILGQWRQTGGERYSEVNGTIRVVDKSGYSEALYRENVTPLIARKISKGVALKWKNPQSGFFKTVVIEKYSKGREKPEYILPAGLTSYFDKDYEKDTYYIIKCVSIDDEKSAGIRIKPE
ncbi:MAG: hypothetical protein JW881_21375 [Spirochaetales bacterium]|nr:hypothetical protein [Spirochaetales bacterium]